VFVDWSQNDQHKTTISVYSLRAREHPTVSTPVSWEEVEETLKKKDPKRLVFESNDVLARVEKMGDLFEPVRSLKQKLPQLEGLGASDGRPDGGEDSNSVTVRAEERSGVGKRTGKTTGAKAKTKGKPALKSAASKSTSAKLR
jgi:bifunctional non-homologous end joining protein LigD